MKKYTNKLVCLLLSFALATIVSCGNNDNPINQNDSNTSKATDAVTTEITRFDELGEKDFGNRIFTILDANDHPDMHVNIPSDSLNGDIINDSLYNRDIFIAERYNVKVKYEQITSGSNGRVALKNSVLADDDSYQLIITPLVGSNSLSTMATEGVLANLSDSEYLSLDKNWWSSLMYNSLRLNGKMFFTTGDIAPTMYQMPACFFLNTKLCEDFGITTDFCQLVRDGRWTLDEHYSIVKDVNKDVNEDGIMHASDDFFGYIHLKANTAVDSLLTTAGIELSSISSDGKSLEININTERNVDIIEKIKRTLVDINFDTQNDIINKAFKEDRALTLTHHTESALVLRDMDSDYLVLPMPKADEKQETYISCANPWADAFIAIPQTADMEYAGFITEALAYYSYTSVRPFAFEMTYNDKISRNDDWAEMLDIIYDTQYIDFNMIYNFSNIRGALTKVLLGSALTTEMASINESSKASIDSFLENWNS